MIWQKINSLASYHAQSLNVPIEVEQLPSDVFTQNNPDAIQVVFKENADIPVKVEELTLHIGYPLNEDNLEVITKALEEHLLPLSQKYHTQKRDQLKKLVLSGFEERKQALKNSVYQADNTLDSLNRQIFELTRTRNIDKHVLDQLSHPSLPICKKIVNEYHQLKKLVPGMYQSITIDDKYLRAITHTVYIQHDGEEFEIGELQIELNLSEGRAKIYNHDNTVNDYPHPHVNSDNEICLGNIASGLRQMMGEYEIFGTLEILHKFVHEYNEDDAYQRIQFWNDPDYSEEKDEYERCREGGSYGRICLDCGDSFCPYYENALNECIEDIHFENCVNCPDRCEPGIELLTDCHDVDPKKCMTCRFTTCLYYKDYESCHSVNQNHCLNCDIMDCPHQGGDDEDETE